MKKQLHSLEEEGLSQDQNVEFYRKTRRPARLRVVEGARQGRDWKDMASENCTPYSTTRGWVAKNCFELFLLFCSQSHRCDVTLDILRPISNRFGSN